MRAPPHRPFYFGLTEEEVAGLLDQAGRAGELPAVRATYNGYLFGGHAIYNPWSALPALGTTLAGETKRRPRAGR